MSRRKHPLWGFPVRMQVTCPSCSARYAVDPRAIGATGRTVQCVRCSHRWFERAAVGPGAVPPPRPVPDVVIRPSPPPLASPYGASYAAPYSGGLPALASPPPPRSTWGWWLGGLAAVVVVVGLVGWALRHEILQLMPPELKAALPIEALRLALRS